MRRRSDVLRASPYPARACRRAPGRPALRAALAGLALAACQSDLTISPDVKIDCTGNEQACPPDMMCHAETGRCVALADRDVEPPGLVGAATLLGSPARDGSRLEVTLTVDEALGAASRVYLDTGEASGEVAFVQAEQLDLGYTWVLSVQRALVPEGTFPVAAHLADRWLNETTVIVGQATLDFTPPGLTSLERTSAQRLAHGAVAGVAFEPAEALAGEPVVTLGGEPMVAESEPGDPMRRCSLRIDSDRDRQGPADVVVELTDLAGNSARHEQTGLFELDWEPASLSAPHVAPPVARLESLVVAQATLSEAVVEDPPPRLRSDPAGLEFTWQGASGRIHTFSHRVDGAAGDGSYQLLIDAQDLAGNPSEGLPLLEVVIDTAPPRVERSELSPESGSAVGAGAAVEVGPGQSLRFRFDVDDDLGGEPTVRLANDLDAPVPLAPVDPDEGWQHTFEGPAPLETSVPLHTIVVGLRDDAGNEAVVRPATVRVDTVAPRAVSGAAAPEAAGLVRPLVYRVRVDEALDEDPTPRLTARRADETLLDLGLGAFVDESRRELRWEHAVAEADDGTWEVSLDRLCDRHGNCSGAVTGPPLAGFSLDSTPPRIEDLRTLRAVGDPAGWSEADRFSAQAGHDSLVVEFSVVDPWSSGELVTEVQLQTPLGWLDLAPGCVVQDGRTRCPLTVGESLLLSGEDHDLRGLVLGASASVWVADPSGNSDLATTDLTLDLAPPSVLQAAVAYVPGDDNPLATPSRATTGTTITVTVIPDEPLDVGRPPELEALCGQATLEFALDDASLTPGSAVFTSTVSDQRHDGECAPAVSLTDVVGNTVEDATFEAPVIRLKTTTPLLHVVQERVRFVRSPWGNAAAETVGGFRFPLGPYCELGPVDPLGGAATLPADTFRLLPPDGRPRQVRVFADAERLYFMGDFAPRDDGTWERETMRLVDVATDYVHVVGVDEAGNSSGPVRIERSELVLSTNRTHRFNPGILRSANTAPGHPLGVVVDGVEVFDEGDDEVLGADGEASTRAAALTWRGRVSSLDSPQAGYGSSLVYDSGRGRVLLFGGADADGAYHSELWEWDGDRWRELPTVGDAPRERADLGASYDSHRDQAFFYAGGSSVFHRTAGVLTGDAWRTDTPVLAPPAEANGRVGHGQAYDARRRVHVVYGGRHGGGYSELTWETDGALWTAAQPEHTPGPRAYVAMAYDHARGRTVLHGGTGIPAGQHAPRVLGDTWEYDGEDWSLVAGEGGPSPRSQHAMVFAAARGALVLFGGKQQDGTALGDTWEYGAWGAPTCPQEDTPCWREADAPAHPHGRRQHAMAWDARSERVVLYGGRWEAGDQTVVPRDTWEWDGVAWYERTPRRPPARTNPGQAYDPVRDRTVVLGGWDGEDTLGDTWEWDGGGWHPRDDDTAPAHRRGAAVVYAPDAGGLLLYGGRQDSQEGEGSTWTYRGDTWLLDETGWSNLTAGSGTAGRRASHALAWCPDCGGGVGCAVLHGGWLNGDDNARADVWEWGPWGAADCAAAPACWRAVTLQGYRPSPRAQHAMVWDPVVGRVVLYGGLGPSRTPLRDTAEYDCQSRSWARRMPRSQPSHSFASGMVFDPELQRSVTAAGSNRPGSSTAGTWAWDGADWTELPVASHPGPRVEHGLSYDEARGELLLFGGGPQPTDDLRSLTTGRAGARRPGFLFLAELETEPLDWTALTGLVVRVHAGGDGYTEQEAFTGGLLSVWRTSGEGAAPGAWEPVDTNDAPADVPDPPAALLTWEAPQEAVVEYLSAEQRRVSLLVTPLAGSRGGREALDARVGIDYAEVRVRYGAN